MCIIRKLLILILIFALLTWLLTGSVLAATSSDVGVTATPDWSAAFTVTYVNDNLITIEWIIPVPWENVIIRAKYGEYPTEPALGDPPVNGYLVYSGNGTTCNDTSMNLDYSGDQLYYRAWAGNTTYYAAYFGQDYVEGIGMTLIAEQLEALNKFLIDFNFPSVIVIILGLTAVGIFSFIAFWKENSIMFILSAGISIGVGFHFFNLHQGALAFALSLIFWAYSIICLIFGLMCMFKRRPAD